MPLDPKIIPDKLKHAIRDRTLVPLIGAGVSKQASPKLPNWTELVEFLRMTAVNKKYINAEEAEELVVLINRGQLLMAAESLRGYFPPGEYETTLEDACNPIGIVPAKVHRAIFKLNCPLILTTNYDLLLEDAHAQEFGRAATVYTYRDSVVVQRQIHDGRFGVRPTIFKLHGSIDEPAEIILTERDYQDMIFASNGYRAVLSALFVTHIVLMLGFSLSDRELLLILEDLRASLKHRSSPDYLFINSKTFGKIERKRLREDFGVECLTYEMTDGHPELLEFIETLATFASPTRTIMS